MAEHEAINNVRRKINEVLKKTDERIVVGWTPPAKQKRNEGEVWTDENGKRWTIKNGIPQSISNLEGAKTPWFCPECQNTMSHRLDTKFWRLRGKCMECVVKEETEMRRLGKWKEYEEQKVRENFVSSLKDKIQELQDLYNTTTSPEFIYADSEKILMTEKWNIDIDKVKQDILEDINELTGVLKQWEENNV
jgi:hypothetical protein